jgi:hypothetical protein
MTTIAWMGESRPMLAEVVTIAAAAPAFGTTPKALRRKIERGVLAEGIHYHRHDGGLFIDVPAYTKLIRGQSGDPNGTRKQRSRTPRQEHQDRVFVSG